MHITNKQWMTTKSTGRNFCLPAACSTLIRHSHLSGQVHTEGLRAGCNGTVKLQPSQKLLRWIEAFAANNTA